MRPTQISGFLFAFAIAAFGCASEPDDGSGAPRDWDIKGGPAKAPGDPQNPTAGADAPACAPKTCQDLNKTSGPAEDGCGKALDCGAAASCTDAKKGNTTNATAADLGAMTDSPMSTRLVADLKLADGEEDWFKFKVTDTGFGGNPRIDVSVTVGTAEVGVFYLCDSQPDFSTCTTATDTPDTTVGKGCRAKGKVSLTADCKGITDNGTAYVRVRKSAADRQCTTYALNVTVN